LDLTGDLIVTDRFTFQGHIEGNGHQIVVDGGSLDWDGFTVNNVRRIIHVGDCGVSTLRNGTITNSGVTGQTGSYPLHWHLCGDTTRGTVVDNVTVRNGRNHAFVPHGSHGITIINSAAINTIDEAFWWDMPGTNSECVKGVGCGFVDNSDDIVVDNMLVDGVTSSTSRDRRMSGMLLGAGERNTVRDSHVTNVHGRTDCAGYHWPEFLGGSNRGQPVVWTFENNTADNDDCHGIFVWQNDSDIHRIVGFSGDGIDHGAYRNAYQYINVDVPYMEVHAAGVSVDGGHIGVVTVKRHRNTLQPTATFTDVQIDRFVVANSSNSGDIPGYYILINTGLSCSDIEGSGVPGTVVVVDGDAC